MSNKFQAKYNDLRTRWLKAKDTNEGLDILQKMKELRQNHPEIKPNFGME